MTVRTLDREVMVTCLRCHAEESVPFTVHKTRENVYGIGMGDTEIEQAGPCTECGADGFNALETFVLEAHADRAAGEPGDAHDV